MGSPTNPVGGPGSPQGPRGAQGSSSPDPNAFKKVVEKVEKVGETENEGRSKQKYRTQEELEAEGGGPAEPQTPMALFASTPPTASSAAGAIATPGVTPPPTAAAPPAPAAPLADDFAGLPHDPDFYDDLDISSNLPSPAVPQPATGAAAHEATSEKGKGKKGAALPAEGSPKVSAGKKKHEEEPSFTPPSTSQEPQWVMRAREKEERDKEPDAAIPPRAEQPWSPASAPPPSKKEGRREQQVRRREEEPRDLPWQPVSPTEGASKKSFKKEASSETISAPSQQALPVHVDAAAQVAVQRMAPYLNPEIAPLFYQMVGSILVMTSPPGISRTEVILNAANFRSSVFYGSTITIEKYATAPDSLNIRLSGSPEAVAKFQENIPTLYAAFERANFKFRIGRLDTEQRPLFRRKERGQAKGDDDFV